MKILYDQQLLSICKIPANLVEKFRREGFINVCGGNMNCVHMPSSVTFDEIRDLIIEYKLPSHRGYPCP